MGLFDKLKGSLSQDSATGSSDYPTTSSNDLSNQSATADKPRKKSLYERYQDKKRGPGTSAMNDDDLKKYTGMERAEFEKYSATTPGVAGGQAAGSITAAPHGGIGMGGVEDGLGGWGREAGRDPVVR